MTFQIYFIKLIDKAAMHRNFTKKKKIFPKSNENPSPKNKRTQKRTGHLVMSSGHSCGAMEEGSSHILQTHKNIGTAFNNQVAKLSTPIWNLRSVHLLLKKTI